MRSSAVPVNDTESFPQPWYLDSTWQVLNWNIVLSVSKPLTSTEVGTTKETSLRNLLLVIWLRYIYLSFRVFLVHFYGSEWWSKPDGKADVEVGRDSLLQAGKADWWEMDRRIIVLLAVV